MSKLQQEKLPVRAVVLCCDDMFQRYLAVQAEQSMTLAGIVFQREAQNPSTVASRFHLFLNPRHLLGRLIGRWVIRSERRGRPAC